MNFQRKCLIVLLSLLLYCELMEATGFGKFARMFPSQANNNTCGDVAKVRNHMESTKRYETSEIATMHKTAQLPLTEQELTSDQNYTKQLTSTPPTSPAKQELTFDQQTTKQVTSKPTTSPTKQELTSDQQTTEHLTSTPPTSPPCVPNMVLGPSCDCERTCQDPTSCNCSGPETCVCPDGFLMNKTECVPEQECGCYYDNETRVIPDGATYVQEDCSWRCTCTDNVLNCDSAYTCSPHATCRGEYGLRQCYCNDGYVGDSETCKLYTDCYDAYQDGHTKNGNFTILPYGWSGSPFNVSCDMTTSGGGWTMIQLRLRIGIFGQRSWQDLKDGFGSNSDRHWLGNEKIFYLTNQRNYTLRVDIVSSDDSSTYQEYSLFKIASESDNYRLIDLGSSSGTAGDGMDGSLGRQFSTKDMDNDDCDDINCSIKYGQYGWWYSNKWCNECCNSNEKTCFYHQSNNCHTRCTKANLNGWYGVYGSYTGIFWNDIHDITATEMKIRPATRAVQ